MSRPESAHDVIDLVARARLIGESHLARLLAGPADAATPEAALGLLVADGLLTGYQAEEVAAGRWRGLWLGAYRVLDRLGRGGMSQVYLAEHAVLGKRVAAKVLSAALRADPDARRRFVREARAAAAVDHPNVVHVFDVDIDHDPPFLVMEYVNGVSLQAAVSRHGTFEGGEAAAVGGEVARGLHAAAAAGLVHRDVKPANLLIDRRGGVKILDLGIVRLPGDETLPRGSDSELILGTIDYLAPEQALDAAVDARADLYALGATLYFLLAGHPPFTGTSVRQKLAAKQSSDPAPVHRLRPDVPAGLSGVIQTLLARDPAARYRTGAETAAALAPFAAAPAGFPARLFRTPRSKTAADGGRPGDPTPQPPTRVIRKGSAPPRVADPGPATDHAGADLATVPLPPVPAGPGTTAGWSYAPARYGLPGISRWVLLGALVVAGLIAAGLACR